MNIKIVKRPFQSENLYEGSHHERQYDEYIQTKDSLILVAAHWVVRVSMILQRDGGVLYWLERMNELNPKVIYLYELTHVYVEIEGVQELACRIRYDAQI